MVAKGRHAARVEAEAQAFGVACDGAARPCPARPTRPGRHAQLPVPVARRFRVQHARRVVQHPPQPQPPDDVRAVDALAVAGGRLEQPRLDRRRTTGCRGRVDRRAHRVVGQNRWQGLGESQLANPESEIAHDGPWRFHSGLTHFKILELSSVADRSALFCPQSRWPLAI